MLDSDIARAQAEYDAQLPPEPVVGEVVGEPSLAQQLADFLATASAHERLQACTLLISEAGMDDWMPGWDMLRRWIKEQSV